MCIRDRSTIPACPSLLRLFYSLTGTILKGLMLRKFCLVFVCVYVLFCVKLCRDLVLEVFENLWLLDLCAEWLGEILTFAFSPDIILCG